MQIPPCFHLPWHQAWPDFQVNQFSTPSTETRIQLQVRHEILVSKCGKNYYLMFRTTPRAKTYCDGGDMGHGIATIDGHGGGAHGARDDEKEEGE